MPFEGTRAYAENTLGLHDSRFRVFKEYVRSRIDTPMLMKVFPAGTVLRGVIVEEQGPLSFGRQMGSYPILIGIPVHLPVRSVIDAVVVGWGSRSVTALPVPVDVNRLPAGALRWLPGIGKNKVASIIAKRPFRTLAEFHRVAGATPIDRFLVF
jgi:radical SAM superfamily enzyme with C-terminal helix-hairpin-helix motif